MTRIARHVFVSGRVQGGWFRGWTCQQAEALDLTGWVRNRRDGRVELLLVGEETKLGQMLVLIRIGPPLAQVHELEVLDTEPRVLEGFTQKASV